MAVHLFCTRNSLLRCGMELMFHPSFSPRHQKEATMGRGILLWLIGVPIPVIIILALLFHH